MFEFLLPILALALVVFTMMAFALSGRRLQGSCGGVGPDGSCSRCGRSAEEMAAAKTAKEMGAPSCPPAE